MRKKLSQELGFLVPAVHIRDNLDLAPNQYRITLMGVSTGEANVYHDKEMAINPGQVFGQIQGLRPDPAFGLEAVWVAKEQVSQAQTLGYSGGYRDRGGHSPQPDPLQPCRPAAGP